MATPEINVTGLIRGDTEKLKVNVTKNGAPVDLTASGQVLWFTVKKEYSNDDSYAVIQKTTKNNGGIATNSTPGEAIIFLTSAETLNVDCEPYKYHYDVQLVNTNSNPVNVETVVRGSISWQPDVTRSIS